MFTLLFFGLVYFLPTIVAVHRGHGLAGILLLNLFLGWTGIGWLAMLLWALLSWPRYCVAVPPPPMYGGLSGWYR